MNRSPSRTSGRSLSTWVPAGRGERAPNPPALAAPLGHDVSARRGHERAGVVQAVQEGRSEADRRPPGTGLRDAREGVHEMGRRVGRPGVAGRPAGLLVPVEVLPGRARREHRRPMPADEGDRLGGVAPGDRLLQHVGRPERRGLRARQRLVPEIGKQERLHEMLVRRGLEAQHQGERLVVDGGRALRPERFVEGGREAVVRHVEGVRDHELRVRVGLMAPLRGYSRRAVQPVELA